MTSSRREPRPSTTACNLLQAVLNNRTNAEDGQQENEAMLFAE